jgi:hypothetical protein
MAELVSLFPRGPGVAKPLLQHALFLLIKKIACRRWTPSPSAMWQFHGTGDVAISKHLLPLFTQTRQGLEK